jgi:hypothetical protein
VSATETLRDPVPCEYVNANNQQEARTSQETAQVGCRMRELVLLIASVLQRDEDAEVVCSRNHAHACSGELGTQLVVASCAYAFLGTFDVEGGDGRVVRGLFGEVRDGYGLGVARHAVGAARGRRGGCLERRMAVFNLPVTLQGSVNSARPPAEGVTYAEELAQRRVVGLAWLALDIFLAGG